MPPTIKLKILMVNDSLNIKTSCSTTGLVSPSERIRIKLKILAVFVTSILEKAYARKHQLNIDMRD